MQQRDRVEATYGEEDIWNIHAHVYRVAHEGHVDQITPSVKQRE